MSEHLLAALINRCLQKVAVAWQLVFLVVICRITSGMNILLIQLAGIFRGIGIDY